MSQNNSYGKIPAVCEITKLSPATIWRKAKDSKSGFPKPFKVGEKSTLWDLNEVVEWVESYKAQRG
jgi:predicted DNA-binding transcriptional regulator AlpA